MHNLAEVLSQWRFAARLTVREAAARIGLAEATFSRLERGSRINVDTLRAVLYWLLASSSCNVPEEAVYLPPDEEVHMGRSGESLDAGDGEA